MMNWKKSSPECGRRFAMWIQAKIKRLRSSVLSGFSLGNHQTEVEERRARFFRLIREQIESEKEN